METRIPLTVKPNGFNGSPLREIQMDLKIDEKYDLPLLEIAENFGYTWGGKPSVGKLLNAIALGELILSKSDRQELCHYEKLDLLIKSKQPFQLLYVDAAGEDFTFLASYAEINKRDNIYYLDILLPEASPDADFPPLARNRCLRIDRIPVSSQIVPVDIDWNYSGLDEITVRFKLFGNLAFSYSKEPSDFEEESEDGKIITRQVSNLFWFRRKILQYGSQVKILCPKSAIAFHLEDLKKAIARY